MKTDVTYLYLEEIFITSISVLQTVVCIHIGFCIHLMHMAILIITFFIDLEEMNSREVFIELFSVQ